MAGSSWFRRLGKTLRAADFCDGHQIPTCEGLERTAIPAGPTYQPARN
jgi:hypothetical protein